VRLSDTQISGIKQATADVFGTDAVVRLFGSRTDVTRRGGDIDLHVEASAELATPEAEVRFRTRLWASLDEPDVDVVLRARGSKTRWIDRAAFRSGIVL